MKHNQEKMPESVCPHCGGSGWKIVERDGASGAERCDCRSQARTKVLEERSGIPSLYSAASIDNLKIPSDNPIAERALKTAVIKVSGFVRDFPAEKQPGLLLMGDPGIGKTHLAVAALRTLISRGFEGVFFDYQSLLQKIHSGYSKEAGTSEREAYRTALEAEVLMIDDLGNDNTFDTGSCRFRRKLWNVQSRRWRDRTSIGWTTNTIDTILIGLTWIARL